MEFKTTRHSAENVEKGEKRHRGSPTRFSRDQTRFARGIKTPCRKGKGTGKTTAPKKITRTSRSRGRCKNGPFSGMAAGRETSSNELKNQREKKQGGVKKVHATGSLLRSGCWVPMGPGGIRRAKKQASVDADLRISYDFRISETAVGADRNEKVWKSKEKAGGKRRTGRENREVRTLGTEQLYEKPRFEKGGRGAGPRGERPSEK